MGCSVYHSRLLSILDYFLYFWYIVNFLDILTEITHKNLIYAFQFACFVNFAITFIDDSD